MQVLSRLSTRASIFCTFLAVASMSSEKHILVIFLSPMLNFPPCSSRASDMIRSVVLLPALKPACSPLIISSAGHLFQITYSMTLLKGLMRLIVLKFSYLLFLFRECSNQRLTPWGRPFFCSADAVIDMVALVSFSSFCWYDISSDRLSLFSSPEPKAPGGL